MIWLLQHLLHLDGTLENRVRHIGMCIPSLLVIKILFLTKEPVAPLPTGSPGSERKVP